MVQTGFSNPFRHSTDLKIDPVIAGRLHFKWLPEYAQFLKENRIPELAAEQSRLFYELNIPLLGYFAHLSPEELLEFEAGESGNYSRPYL